MVCVTEWSTIPSLKLRDYLSVQAHKPCSISHLYIAMESSVSVLGRVIGDNYLLKQTHMQQTKHLVLSLLHVCLLE